MHERRVQPQELRPAAHGGALRGLALVLARVLYCDLVGAEAVSVYNKAAAAPLAVGAQICHTPSLPLRGLIGQWLCSAQGHGQWIGDGR